MTDNLTTTSTSADTAASKKVRSKSSASVSKSSSSSRPIMPAGASDALKLDLGKFKGERWEVLSKKKIKKSFSGGNQDVKMSQKLKKQSWMEEKWLEKLWAKDNVM